MFPIPLEGTDTILLMLIRIAIAMILSLNDGLLLT